MNFKSFSAFVTIVAAMMFSSVGIAKETKALIVADGKFGKRICYYEDKAYTSGAVLNIGGVLLLCTNENSFESNGALKWVIVTPEKK